MKNLLLGIYLITGGAVFFSKEAMAQHITQTLVPPKIEEVAKIENSPIYVYSTNELKFEVTRDEIIRFIKQGKLEAWDSDRDKLRKLAPYTPPENLNKLEKERVESWGKNGSWIDASTMYSIGTGALSTKNGDIYFWWKINDRVLWLAQWNVGCYLVLGR